MNDFGISSALSDYLNAIYVLSQKKNTVRITDIAEYLGISKPSVNRAVNTLKRDGYVTHEPYGDIMLTQKGWDLGRSVYVRRGYIQKFLISVLDMSPEDAESEASSMAHSVSRKTVDRMLDYMSVNV